MPDNTQPEMAVELIDDTMSAYLDQLMETRDEAWDEHNEAVVKYDRLVEAMESASRNVQATRRVAEASDVAYDKVRALLA